jgi:hypothetical protein
LTALKVLGWMLLSLKDFGDNICGLANKYALILCEIRREALGVRACYSPPLCPVPFAREIPSLRILL